MKRTVHERKVLVASKVLFFFFCIFLFNAGIADADSSLTMPTVADPGYTVQTIVPRTYGNGFNGIAFDKQDNLYAGCVQSQTLYKVDKETGAVVVFIPPPEGMSDDMVFTSDGKVIWTGFFLGKVFSKSADVKGKITTLAENAPGANAVAVGKDGRVFFTQVFLADALWELDMSGKMKNRKIAENFGGLNAFQVHTDGYIYGPLEYKGQVAKIDVNTGKVQVIAEGFKTARATKFDSKGNFFVLDSKTGEVIQVDIKTGQKKLIAIVEPHLDNLALDSKDRMFVSSNGSSSIFEVDVKTGKVRTVVEGKLACPQGIAVWNSPQGEILFVADNFAYKTVDAFTGAVKESAKGGAFPNSAAIMGDKVLMTGWFRNVVEVFDAKTNDLLYGIPGFKTATGILMLPDETILVAEAGTGSIIKVSDKEGKKRDVLTKDLDLPVYMAQADSNFIYVTEFLAGRISRVDLKTGSKKIIAQGLKNPKGIAMKKDGTILVVNTGTRELVQIDPATGVVKPFVKNLAVGLPVPKGFMPAFTLTGVTISESGNIYVASDVENTIYKISPK